MLSKASKLNLKKQEILNGEEQIHKILRGFDHPVLTFHLSREHAKALSESEEKESRIGKTKLS